VHDRKADNLLRRQLWLEQCAWVNQRAMTPSELRLWSALKARRLCGWLAASAKSRSARGRHAQARPPSGRVRPCRVPHARSGRALPAMQTTSRPGFAYPGPCDSCWLPERTNATAAVEWSLAGKRERYSHCFEEGCRQAFPEQPLSSDRYPRLAPRRDAGSTRDLQRPRGDSGVL
jgi:hypothetical protein